ncbi:MAG: [FeFe] hydrogenase H-cluster maturation GTPase HydF [Candidatus Omnitrophica bacterium]|nr:[FeFe] hydrogenase H-cluster maturation GTPase HydF [Candidatus Omnitrophota bacterium]
MKTTPKSLRLQIGIFGRTNVGKSSFLNLVTGQDVSITSDQPGTTTDVVEKVMELLPVGPVVFLDTAGLDDRSFLGEKRLKKTEKIFNRSEIIVLIVEPDIWTNYEQRVFQESCLRERPLIIVVNKVDINSVSDKFIGFIESKTKNFILVSSTDSKNRDRYLAPFKELLLKLCPDNFLKTPPILNDLIPKGGVAVLIVPIDLEAPKGRIILPQVQAIRDALDGNQAALVVKESEYLEVLNKFSVRPDIVVCDSQVVDFMIKNTPADIPATTFSILFSRYRGDIAQEIKGVLTIDNLNPEDRILIAEACSHHPIEDDIGRVKLPKWLSEYLGFNVRWDSCAGRDYPENFQSYKLIIHCGACMITRYEMLNRIEQAIKAGVAITNYGICISYLKGVLERVIAPIPGAVDLFNNYKKEFKYGVKRN